MLAWLEASAVGQVMLFTYVLARVGGLVGTLPLFTGGETPMQVRAILAIAMALLLTPLQLAAAPTR